MPHLNDNGRIRLVGSADKHLFRDHLLRLDPETRRSRFAMLAGDGFLRAYVETSFALDTVIYGYFEDGLLRGTAELRPVGGASTAEAAFCVEENWRGRGLGTELMELLLIAARARNCQHIYMNCLATNRSMQALARKFSADLSFECGDVVGHLMPPAENPITKSPAAGDPLEGWSRMAFGIARKLLGLAPHPGAARN